MELFNMGFIILIISFDPTNTFNKLSGNPDEAILNGFEPKWYTQMGQSICSTIFLSAISSNIPVFQSYLRVEFKRLVDRGFKKNLKKDLEDEIDDEPNSKMKL